MGYARSLVNSLAVYIMYVYTGQQKKGYKVICLLFIKLNDIFFLHIVNIIICLF